MSRSPNRNEYLPPIKTIYEESFGSARGSPTQKMMVPYRQKDNGGERMYELENRLELQERTTQQLVDRAIQIKQELIENLGLTQGTWQEERNARELLQEHVRTITAVIRQMNKDVKALDGQIKEKENMLQGTGNIMRQIETSQVSSVGELRGRVGRCDSSIAKLAGDLRLMGDSVRVMGADLHDHQGRLQEKLQASDLKTQDILGRIDKLTSESNSNIRISVDEAFHKMAELDNRLKLALDELRHKVNNLHVYDQSEREKMETKLATNIDRLFANYQSRLERLEDAIHSDKHHAVLLDRMDNLESEFKLFRKERSTYEKELEKKLTLSADRVYRQLSDDVARFKREVRDGFAAVHETIANMKGVLEGKQKLSEESVRKEMAQLRKMVVLI